MMPNIHAFENTSVFDSNLPGSLTCSCSFGSHSDGCNCFAFSMCQQCSIVFPSCVSLWHSARYSAFKEDIDESSVVSERRGQQRVLSELHSTKGRQIKNAQNTRINMPQLIFLHSLFSQQYFAVQGPKKCVLLYKCDMIDASLGETFHNTTDVS